MTSRAFLFLLPVAFAALGRAAEAPSPSLPKDSPFASAGGPTAANAPAETIELAGVSSVGKRTDLVFYDKAAKKSRWVTVGETAEGISVVSYDPRHEQAVVKINGTQKTLTLRKASAPVNTPAGVPGQPVGFNVPPANPTMVPLPLPPQQSSGVAPGAPPSVAPPAAPATPAPQTPESQAKQEQEARMLVSDLLEIGMVQRKAYEEAQRKAAEGATSSTNAHPAQNPPAVASPSGQPGAPATPPMAEPPPSK